MNPKTPATIPTAPAVFAASVLSDAGLLAGPVLASGEGGPGGEEGIFSK